MKKKRLPLAMLAALAKFPIYPFYPVGVKHIDKDTGTEVTDFNIYLSPMEALP